MKKNRDHSSFQVNQLIQQYMKEYLDRITQDDQSRKNNSFVYLENDTLQLLIMYLFIKSENSDMENANFQDLSEILDSYMSDNRQAFEEIMDSLKNRTKGNHSNDED